MHGFYACTQDEADYEDEGHNSAGFDGRAHYDDIQSAAEGICSQEGISPYQREIFEHWAISPRLAEDLAGLCVWGRTTTGQMIEMDHVMWQVAQLINDRATAIMAEVM